MDFNPQIVSNASNHFSILAVSLTLALSSSFSSLHPANASAYSDGVQAYNKHDYAGAVRLLKSSADGGEGKSAQADMIHYYLALAYQATNQRALAGSEFGWVYSHTVNAALKQYAEKGYQHYVGKSPSAAPSGSATTASPGATGAASTGAAASSTTAAASVAKTAAVVPDLPPRGGYLARNSAELSVSGGGNMDCGPTCLVTVFKLFNRYPRNLPNNNDGAMVEATRLLMTGNGLQDYTTVDQMMPVLKGAGLRTERFDGKERLDYWLRAGVPVISLGPPYGPGGYGHRVHPGRENADTGHYIVVTGMQNGGYSINDPMAPESHQLSQSEMTAYINGEGFKGRYKMRSIAVSP